MKFKIGDKVRIRKDSEFYGDGSQSFNPPDINGEIISTNHRPLKIRVKWDNGTKNSYNKNDLEYWYKEPLKELYFKIFNQSHRIGDIHYIKHILDYEEELSDDSLRECRRLWEKYNKK